MCCQGRFGVILVLGPANIYLAIRVAQGFGYLAFKTVGAAESLHSTLQCEEASGKLYCASPVKIRTHCREKGHQKFLEG